MVSKNGLKLSKHRSEDDSKIKIRSVLYLRIEERDVDRRQRASISTWKSYLEAQVQAWFCSSLVLSPG